ncbi:hypothetical protein NBH00_06720 [Paraconexibacter antarcticus]|uniref:Flp family type IVb pilin n=1 Tax=Paraconexibacter antarcticus TaxID=2949664 RepID=A0ABY5DV67_9ACTN|nr:hypothetical protein [Paraconexibacter antarcticus]UTI65900.1 hypothetical protein NBH00_06720 [Paraconexibacter antarcticus]
MPAQRTADQTHPVGDDLGQSTVEYASVLLTIVIVVVLFLAAGMDGALDPVIAHIKSAVP